MRKGPTNKMEKAYCEKDLKNALYREKICLEEYWGRDFKEQKYDMPCSFCNEMGQADCKVTHKYSALNDNNTPDIHYQFKCEFCEYKKTSKSTGPSGRRTQVAVQRHDDINRYVFKGADAVVSLLEADVTLDIGKPCFISIEEIMKKIYKQISNLRSSAMLQNGTNAHFHYLNMAKQVKHMWRGNI